MRTALSQSVVKTLYVDLYGYVYFTFMFIILCFSDIMNIYKEPPPGMCVVADSEDVTKVLSC